MLTDEDLTAIEGTVLGPGGLAYGDDTLRLVAEVRRLRAGGCRPRADRTEGQKMSDEFEVRVSSAHFPVYRDICVSREAAEASARLTARRFAFERGEPVEVQVTISRRRVTPWKQEGETYSLDSAELAAVR